MLDFNLIKSVYSPKQTGQLSLFDDVDSLLERSFYIPLETKTENRELIAYWWMKVYDPTKSMGFEIYKSWHNALNNNFDYIYEGGYNPETNQASIKLMCNQYKPLQDHLDELSHFMKYIIPSFPNDKECGDKVKYLGVFEHTCSEYGVYSLYIYDDGHVELERLTYHVPTILKTFKCLADAIDYVRINHYYE